MSSQHRTHHIPLSLARFGSRIRLIQDMALASFNQETNNVDDFITQWKIHTITGGEEFAGPTLAYERYGDEGYWWFLCWYNGIVNPTRELYAGREIKMPDFSQMKSYLAAISKTQSAPFVTQ